MLTSNVRGSITTAGLLTVVQWLIIYTLIRTSVYLLFLWKIKTITYAEITVHGFEDDCIM